MCWGAGKRFVTNTKNVAQERDFNRIESDTLPPDALETAYGLFEGELAPVLRKLSEGATISEDDFSYVLTLIGLLAIRNPKFRGNFSEFQDTVRHQMIAVATATKERWEGQLAQAKAAGYLDGVKDVPYETIRASVERRDFKFVTTPHEHAQTELHARDDLINLLARRSWRWVRANRDAGDFITCDHPVCLNWIRRPRGLAPIGYGLSGTTVFFPISPNLAVLGEFGGQTDDVAADAFAVADFNRRVVNNANRQVFAKDDNFQLFDGRDFFGAADLLKRAQEKNAASSHNQVKQHDA
jgi:hypothetical protein